MHTNYPQPAPPSPSLHASPELGKLEGRDRKLERSVPRAKYCSSQHLGLNFKEGRGWDWRRKEGRREVKKDGGRIGREERREEGWRYEN